MDNTVQKIYDFSTEVDRQGFSSEVTNEIKKRIADSIFTSYGAKDSVPINIMRKALLPSGSKRNSTVYFTRQTASPEIATFINGSMTRYLDYNDTYLSKEALHPSDNVPPVMALSESFDIDGKRSINAIGVAYQVVCSLADAVSIRDLGWDHVTYISISAASGLAHLLDLDPVKFENAVSLGINNNISMRQTRAGELSMWKGCTAANASRNSVFATLLANDGFTGPYPVFEGEMGFFKQVSGEFNLDLKADRIKKTMIKNYPVEYHAMSAAEAASNIRNRMKGDIKKIEVETFTVAHTIIIKDPEKLRPKTKETADHSMPFIIAYTLAYGDPVPDSYSDKYLKDGRILDLIDRSTFRVTEKFDSMYPEFLPVKIKVTTDAGEYEEEIDIPKGHHKSPYSWDDLRKKGARVAGDDFAKNVVDLVSSFEKRSARELLEVISDVDTER
ncbi:hypothetical protein IX51_00075 [uncultured archaeon]|nr:hypothetical protein IX51_00075 [uncultured archaeon]